jgi:hypothetical protein
MAEPLSAAIAADTNTARDKTNVIVLAKDRHEEGMGMRDIGPSLAG